MVDDPTIRPGDSFNIATEGYGSGDPISVATSGYLEPDVNVADIVVGGDGGVTVRFTYPGTGGINTGGGVPVIYEADGTVIYYYPATGGVTTGGDPHYVAELSDRTDAEYNPNGSNTITTGGVATTEGPFGIIVPDTATLTLTAFDVEIDQLVNVDAASLTLTPFEPNINQTVAVDTATLTLTTFAIDIAQDIDVDTASLTLTANTANVIERIFVETEDLTLTGNDHLAVISNDYAGSGEIVFSGAATTNKTFAYTSNGGLNTGGNTDDTSVTIIFNSNGNSTFNAGIIMGGAATTKGPGDRSGMGAPRKYKKPLRKRHVTPHHYIWTARTDRIRVSGEADSTFIQNEPLLQITLDKVLIPISFKDYVKDFTPKKKLIDFTNFEELRARPQYFNAESEGGETGLAGTADTVFISKYYERALKEDEEIVELLNHTSRQPEFAYCKYSYDEQIIAEDEEILLILGD
jgi:hypothetical protein